MMTKAFVPVLAALVLSGCAVWPAGVPAQGDGWFLVAPPLDDVIMAIFRPDPPQWSPADTQRIGALRDEVKREPSSIQKAQITLEAMIDTRAPLERWVQLEAFDNARACEARRRWTFSVAETKIKAMLPEFASSASADHAKTLSALKPLAAARCVPASAVVPAPQR